MSRDDVQPKHYKLNVVRQDISPGGDCLLILEAPELARTARPGQFVHVLCGTSADPLLRRPFSIYDARPEDGQILVLYEIRGKGTRSLSRKSPGDVADLLGPLGTGFVLPDSVDQLVYIVGGGIGAAPLYFLAERIADSFGPECMTFFTGASTAGRLSCFDDFWYFCQGIGADERYCVCTDDGSLGDKGLVTELLEERLVHLRRRISPLVYACGPMPMLREVARITRERGLKCQVCVEAKMACGVGACMSCAIKVRDGDGWKYVRACREGPVFGAEEIVWEDG